jgi:hypothetical protein
MTPKFKEPPSHNLKLLEVKHARLLHIGQEFGIVDVPVGPVSNELQ